MELNIHTLKRPSHNEVRAVVTGSSGDTAGQVNDDLQTLHIKLGKAIPYNYRPKFNVTQKELVMSARAPEHMQLEEFLIEIKQYLIGNIRRIENDREKREALVTAYTESSLKASTGMKPFIALNAIAAPLPIDNVDTDMIIPKQFLKTIKRTGLKEGLFYEMRFDVNGVKNEAFVLHRVPYIKAEILVSGANFGCGSSREHAPWALLDFGIRCVIAQSFADIFFNNCFKNGILPIVLPKDQIDALMKAAETEKRIAVNLDKQTVLAEGQNQPYTFEVEPFRKNCLIYGLDDIGLTLKQLDSIAAYENDQKQRTPWLAATA